MLCAHLAGHYMYPRLREGSEMGTNLSGLLHGQQLTAAGGGDQCLTFWYTVEGNAHPGLVHITHLFLEKRIFSPKRLYFLLFLDFF